MSADNTCSTVPGLIYTALLILKPTESCTAKSLRTEDTDIIGAGAKVWPRRAQWRPDYS